MLRKFSLLLFSLLFIQVAFSQTPRLQLLLDSLRSAGNFPGLSFAIVDKDNTSAAFTSGFNDKEKNSLT